MSKEAHNQSSDAVDQAALAADTTRMMQADAANRPHVLTPAQAHENEQATHDITSRIQDASTLDAASHSDWETIQARLFNVLGHTSDGKETFENSAAGRMQQYLNGTEAYDHQREYVMEIVNNVQRRFLDALREKLRNKAKVRNETTGKLEELAHMVDSDETGKAGMNRFISVMGQAYKLHNDGLADNSARARSESEVMDMEELSGFTDLLTFMQTMDPAEMTDMIIENQLFLTMIAQAGATPGQPLIKDNISGTATNPSERGRDADVAADLMRDFFQVEIDPSKPDQQVTKLSLESLVDTDKHLIGERVKDHNFVALVNLMMGNEAVIDGKKLEHRKSKQRLVIEGAMAGEILARMTPGQREYLFYVMNREYGAAATRTSLEEGLKYGVINIKNLEQMARIPALAWTASPEFMTKAHLLVKVHEQSKKMNETLAAQKMKGQVESAVMQFMSPQGLAGVAAYVGGFITFGANAFITIMDAVKANNDSMLEGVLTGIGDVFGNGFCYAGAALVIGGRHLLEPITAADLVHIKPADREMVARDTQKQFFDAALVNHPRLQGYLTQNWEHLEHIAGNNKEGLNPKRYGSNPNETAASHKGVYQIYPGDLMDELDPLEVKRMGFNNREEAEAEIAMMFSVAQNVLAGTLIPPKNPGDFKKENFVNYSGGVLANYAPAGEQFRYGTLHENLAHGVKLDNAPST